MTKSFKKSKNPILGPFMILFSKFSQKWIIMEKWTLSVLKYYNYLPSWRKLDPNELTRANATIIDNFRTLSMFFRLGYSYMNTAVSWNISLEVHCYFFFKNSKQKTKKRRITHIDKNQYKKATHFYSKYSVIGAMLVWILNWMKIKQIKFMTFKISVEKVLFENVIF